MLAYARKRNLMEMNAMPRGKDPNKDPKRIIEQLIDLAQQSIAIKSSCLEKLNHQTSKTESHKTDQWLKEKKDLKKSIIADERFIREAKRILLELVETNEMLIKLCQMFCKRRKEKNVWTEEDLKRLARETGEKITKDFLERV